MREDVARQPDVGDPAARIEDQGEARVLPQPVRGLAQRLAQSRMLPHLGERCRHELPQRPGHVGLMGRDPPHRMVRKPPRDRSQQRQLQQYVAEALALDQDRDPTWRVG